MTTAVKGRAAPQVREGLRTEFSFVLPRGSTVEDLADAVHHEVRERLQYAVRWPAGSAPLRVAHHYELRDGDVIELHTT